MFQLADRLGKSISEIEHWPEDEIAEWRAFYKIQKGMFPK